MVGFVGQIRGEREGGRWEGVVTTEISGTLRGLFQNSTQVCGPPPPRKSGVAKPSIDSVVTAQANQKRAPRACSHYGLAIAAGCKRRPVSVLVVRGSIDQQNSAFFALRSLLSHQEAQQHVEQQQQREGMRELDRHQGRVEQDAPEALVEADERHQEGDAQVAPRVPNLGHGTTTTPWTKGGGRTG